MRNTRQSDNHVIAHLKVGVPMEVGRWTYQLHADGEVVRWKPGGETQRVRKARRRPDGGTDAMKFTEMGGEDQ